MGRTYSAFGIVFLFESLLLRVFLSLFCFFSLVLFFFCDLFYQYTKVTCGETELSLMIGIVQPPLQGGGKNVLVPDYYRRRLPRISPFPSGAPFNRSRGAGDMLLGLLDRAGCFPRLQTSSTSLGSSGTLLPSLSGHNPFYGSVLESRSHVLSSEELPI